MILNLFKEFIPAVKFKDDFKWKRLILSVAEMFIFLIATPLCKQVFQLSKIFVEF